ncbi:MAG: hypothetical protein LBL82_05815 [Oscillospiraceae bacterium]|jgi:hypothetical protein|nr:hypothetical protein [Oscillospiraceae bacterium]
MRYNGTIKEHYGFIYDKGDFKSSLTEWYNNLIDKTYGELDVQDVTRMLRQSILPDVAIQRAIELFEIDPFCGELVDGDILRIIVENWNTIKDENLIVIIRNVLKDLRVKTNEFDWMSSSCKDRYLSNIDIAEGLIK